VCNSFDALIQSASREVENRLGIAAALDDRRGYVLSPSSAVAMAESTVALSLNRSYMSKSIGTNVPGAKEIYMEKSLFYGGRFEDKLGHVTIKFDDNQSVETSSRFVRIYF
jgi:hypothetical protein